MSDNIVVRTTVDFIRSSSKNLDLALQVEEAMPEVRADLIGEFLESVEARIPPDDWRLHKSGAGLFKGRAWLGLRGANWPADHDPADQTGILLSTDKGGWKQVYIGVYFSKTLRNRIEEFEQDISPALSQASKRLPSGQGWQTHEFSQQSLGKWGGWATYRYFDEPIYNWGCAEFMRNSLDAGRKLEMVEQVVSRMELLKSGASALVQAASRAT